jgi:hypothetical protein
MIRIERLGWVGPGPVNHKCAGAQDPRFWGPEKHKPPPSQELLPKNAHVAGRSCGFAHNRQRTHWRQHLSHMAEESAIRTLPVVHSVTLDYCADIWKTSPVKIQL